LDGSDRRAAGGALAQTVRDTTFRKLDEQKARASGTLGSLAGAVRGMTQPLREGGQTGVADYVNQAADNIERWASQLGQQDIEDAVRGVQQFARRQPAVFLGVGFALGVVASRFLKSSSTYSAGSLREPVGERRSQWSGGTPGELPRLSSDLRPAREVL
jgi:hypothetical protein